MSEKVEGYFCNCIDKGEKRKNYSKFRKVEVDEDQACVHCGYYAPYQDITRLGKYSPYGYLRVRGEKTEDGKYKYDQSQRLDDIDFYPIHHPDVEVR